MTGMIFIRNYMDNKKPGFTNRVFIFDINYFNFLIVLRTIKKIGEGRQGVALHPKFKMRF